MKKIGLVMVMGLLLLTACKTKEKEAKKDVEQSLPQESYVWNRSEDDNNQVLTKTLVFPEVDGVTQKQIIRYQGKQWLGLTLEQTQPANDEVKGALGDYGLEETQKALDESLTRDENYQAVKDLAGFSYSIKLSEDGQLLLTTTYDFTKFQVAKMKGYAYFKESNIPEMMESSPSKYIESRISNGAKLVE